MAHPLLGWLTLIVMLARRARTILRQTATDPTTRAKPATNPLSLANPVTY